MHRPQATCPPRGQRGRRPEWRAGLQSRLILTARATMSTDLIVQGLDIETSDLKRLAKLSGASAIEQLDSRAFRLRGSGPAAGMEELCSERALDVAYVPA